MPEKIKYKIVTANVTEEKVVEIPEDAVCVTINPCGAALFIDYLVPVKEDGEE